ncbi:bis(5'-nucleosyl)-tetraphosphatase (symmetrical) YqeK [Alicyclobacillus sp.]|uniref:bis(5'-nucleosyl)-tetraphosphatase (symmetrical) YqeK n=1 Tax=Alicyclobacillus sp. TaxID=61169 RepID=UPI0025B9C271|nr:bis(5'-nucleosyl)-tetraphosphatase (symmetrical) YqeK [Alicyclobacillus sp.]MCL6515976.1 bis(5'-nucleosyl)-tetraphosphatase (symmetrical) YqeK [Alicyclobacillus sp.]
MREADIRERVRRELSPARFRHTEGVVETAERLALRHGVDPEKARLAAWIHDVAREWDWPRLAEAGRRHGVDRVFFEVPAVLHGPVAAALAKEWFGIDDEDIQNAIRHHTSGRPGMSPLEMVVCLADAVEPGRHYPGVDDLRRTAELDLVRALAESFDSTLIYLIERHQPIFELTVRARNDLWRRVQGGPHESRTREERE